jgi:hypothetical protein
MKHLLLTLPLLFAVITAPVYAGTNFPTEIIALAQNDVSDDLILAFVDENSQAASMLTPADIARLQNAGVSNRVLAALTKYQPGEPVIAAAPSTPAEADPLEVAVAPPDDNTMVIAPRYYGNDYDYLDWALLSPFDYCGPWLPFSLGAIVRPDGHRRHFDRDDFFAGRSGIRRHSWFSDTVVISRTGRPRASWLTSGAVIPRASMAGAIAGEHRATSAWTSTPSTMQSSTSTAAQSSSAWATRPSFAPQVHSFSDGSSHSFGGGSSHSSWGGSSHSSWSGSASHGSWGGSSRSFGGGFGGHGGFGGGGRGR